jgi:hypothetical protein
VQLPPHFLQLETFLLKVNLPAASSPKVKLFIFKWDHHIEAWSGMYRNCFLYSNGSTKDQNSSFQVLLRTFGTEPKKKKKLYPRRTMHWNLLHYLVSHHL